MLVLLLSCAVDASRLDQKALQPELSGPELTAPAPAEAEGAPLYQQLYADEVEPSPTAQRARMLAWMRSLELQEPQLRGLVAAVVTLERLRDERRAALEAEVRAQSVATDPVYEEIVRALVDGEGDLDALALRLQRARVPADQQAALAHVRAQLQAAETWIASLGPDQQARVHHSRIFLRRRFGPLTTPGDYEALVATRWDAGDFDSLALTQGEGEGMDLGGLWASEPWRAHPDGFLDPLQVQAITVMALSEPGLAQAVEVLLGERDPMDFTTSDQQGDIPSQP